ncbi:hypothetical protein [Nonomuraea sp. NPDC005692]|uniref:hypothetical protein n=1 Tax=Nonomuraea sp. NPDC005692 TaxID=3157168 RepID=UPI0033CF56E0
MRTWLAGIAGAVIVAAAGVVFTAWFNARGSDTVGSISGEPPIKVGHVAVEYAAQDTTLREAVTAPAERALLLGAASGTRRDEVMARHDWAPLESADVTVVLVGNRSSLRIVDIQPRVLDRRPVSDGALFVHPGRGVARHPADRRPRPARAALHHARRPGHLVLQEEADRPQAGRTGHALHVGHGHGRLLRLRARRHRARG